VSSSTLTVPLKEMAGSGLVLEEDEQEDPGLLDPLPSLDPPEDRPLVGSARLSQEILEQSQGITHILGVFGTASAFLAWVVQRQSQRPVMVVTPDNESAQQLAADLAFLVGDSEAGEEVIGEQVVVLPHSEVSPYADVNPDRRAMMARLTVLFRLWRHGTVRYLVTPITALLRKVVSASFLQKHTAHVEAETEVDRDALIQTLTSAGYLRVPVVEDPGSFAVRGALLDVWPAQASEPVRIEFYGDLVVSLKPFDPESQRTLLSQEEIWLPPVKEGAYLPAEQEGIRSLLYDLCGKVNLPSSKTRSLIEDIFSGRGFLGAEGYLPAFGDLVPITDYFQEQPIVFMENPAAVTRALRDELIRAQHDEQSKQEAPHFPQEAFYISEQALEASWASTQRVILHHHAVLGEDEQPVWDDFELAPASSPTMDARTHEDLGRAVKQARALKGKTASLEPLTRRITSWHENGLRVVLAARAETQAERLVTLLRHAGVRCRKRTGLFSADMLTDPAGRDLATVVRGNLARGAVLPGEGLVFVTEEEIFGSRAHRRQQRASKGKSSKAFLEDLRALEVGDYVVHTEHGIGKYHGLIHREIGGNTVDLLCVEYAGGDKLYLPVYRLNQIQKFSGKEGTPKLDRLGGSTFSKTKAKVEKQVRKMADELLHLYAERQVASSPPIVAPDDEYQTFEATFPFDETPDQAQAIQEVLTDLRQPRPTDRLVCGDVGFGKTEVAIRAAFLVAMAGRQVAVLCPTTVLAQQHYFNFESRFRDYALTVASMSRFQSKSQQDQVVRGIKAGSVDVVIGTHRLLSKDIHFKNLGLLVVDEEQRFGVTHKERIKKLRKNVDVITLSATPIPRTLQMAVSGLRDMSLITTPPVDRRAIRTLVTRFDDTVLREAVRRELSRGGQVFYVYNRVEGLYEKANHLQALIPEARIAVAHGQLNESTLEQTMFDFVDGKYDVLCATAIIESGLDIPRANTMIIDRADMFGLAQLYQLRGRVGRSKERAYCYLIVPPAAAMTDESRTRIEAMERYTELGSGFQIASLDLELRGAGDLLGANQSGIVASVGLDLYCNMLEEAVRLLRGEEVIHDVDPELSFDVEALLPEQYIDEVGVRLSLYKRLASASDEAEVEELASEMEDRFGPPPQEAKNFVELMRLKTELRKLCVLGCEASASLVVLHLREDTPLDAVQIMALVRQRNSLFRLSPDMKLTRRFTTGQASNGLESTDLMLTELEKYRKKAVS
jgi:transcription-repair coupling factor (superfamily II helicase)